MSSIHKEQGIRNLFEAIEKGSRFKDITLKVLPNGVYRVDVKLLYGLYTRFLLDPSKRIDDMYILGTFIKSKFKGITHFKYQLQYDKVLPIEEANKFEKLFRKLSEDYRHRIRKNN